MSEPVVVTEENIVVNRKQLETLLRQNAEMKADMKDVIAKVKEVLFITKLNEGIQEQKILLKLPGLFRKIQTHPTIIPEFVALYNKLKPKYDESSEQTAKERD